MALQEVRRPISISLRGDFEPYLRSGGRNLQESMRYEALRLGSFSRTSLSRSTVSLAACGFYRTRFWEIRCFSCGIRHRIEQIPVRPVFTQHRGSCLHARGRDQRNVAFWPCRLPELIPSFEQGRPASCEGHLFWTIIDYNCKRQAAIGDVFHYLESPPFYTSRCGYKMCARIYLNGQAVGNVQLAVLCFVILKGEHDASLSWPFRKRVTLCLLNQERSENISQSFIPTHSSSVFTRPVTKNVAFECSLLIDLRELSTKGFLLNDSIIVNVRVND